MPIPLARNRTYRLLWSSRALSELGIQLSVIGFPLLAFTITGSPAAAGVATAVMATAHTVASVPGGALIDRWDRKKTMLFCEAAQGLALVSLVVAIWLGVPSLPHLIAVAAVLGMGEALFEPAEEASLPHVVSVEQLPTALGLNAGRAYFGQLAGSALGGVLFGLGRILPFLGNAIAHLVSFVILLFVRLPVRSATPTANSRLHKEIWDGFKWVWGQRLIRTTALCVVSLNLLFQGLYLIVLVGAQQRGVAAGEIGAMAAMLGVGAMLGAFAAGWLCRVLSPYVAIIGVFWALSLLAPPLAFVGNPYLTGVLLAAIAFLAPTANVTISSRQILITPDELRGRLSSSMNLTAGLAGTVGPALGGVLLQLVGGTTAVLLCAAALVLTALAATGSPTLRNFPAIEEKAAV